MVMVSSRSAYCTGSCSSRSEYAATLRPHRVIAAVDMDEFPCGGRPEVREQADHGPSYGFGVGRLPTQGRLAGPLAFDLLEAADTFGGEGFDRPCRDEVDSDAAFPEIAGEVA